jgi:pimeloyl-ACP methyl ester carboxylesterase
MSRHPQIVGSSLPDRPLSPARNTVRRRALRKTLGGGIALLALAGALTFASYRREIAAAREAALSGSVLIQTARGPVEYADRGSGPPALVIHGAGGGWDQGALVGEMLGEGLRIIAPSRFGYLRTPLPDDGSPAAQAAAHAALLDTIGVNRTVVVGISAGAPSAIEMALRHPGRVSALILLVPRAFSPDQTVGVDESRLSNRIVLNLIMRGADFAYWCMSHFSRSTVVRFLGVPPEVDANASPEARVEVSRVIGMVQPLSARLPGLQNDGELKLSGWPLERIDVPTLVVTAQDDLFGTRTAAEYTARHVRGAKLVVFETGGHLFVGRKSELKAIISEFLKEAAAKRPGRAA